MKNFLFLIFLLGASTVYAGPEEHKASQVCYDLIQTAPAEIPNEICIEAMMLNLEQGNVHIESYFFRQIFEGAGLSYLARHNEDYHSFVVVKDLSNTSYLVLRGRSDNDGYVSVAELEILIHRIEDSQVFNYKLRN